MSKGLKLKKGLLLCVACVLVAALAIGGTVAYLTSEDSAVSVMTLGNVKIEQHEYERVVENGTYKTEEIDGVTSYVLKDFSQAKPLLPATEIDANGLPYNYGAGDYGSTRVKMSQVGSQGSMDVFVNKNVQDKFVTVENTGKTDAYVRTIIAFEIGSLTEDEFDAFIGTSSFMTAQGVWKVTDIGIAAIDGNNYFVSEYIYNGAKAFGGVHENGVLPAGDTTYPSLAQVYMKAAATNETVEAIDGNKNGAYDILVASQAIQTAGFADAETALDAGFGDITTTNHPWTDGVKLPALVSSANELKAALADGGEVILTDDITLTDAPLTVTGDAVLNTNGHTVSGVATNASASAMITVKAGAALTLTGDGVVTFGATTPDINWGGEGQPAFPGYANNTIKCEGKLIIDGVTVKNVTAPGGASYAIDCYQGSELIVNDGVIDGVGKCAIRMFCNSNTLSTNVTVNGGTVTGKRAIWVQLPGSNINNVRPVNLTINGGELICTNTETDVCVYSYSYGDSFAGTNIQITGGTFIGDVCFGGGDKSTRENVTVTGGVFHGELGRYLADGGWEPIEQPQ